MCVAGNISILRLGIYIFYPILTAPSFVMWQRAVHTLAYWPACMRCFTIYTGTRIEHATVSPQTAAKLWANNLVCV